MINLSYWSNLNPRERWLVGPGACFTITYLCYLLVYAPLATGLVNSTKRLQEKQETLAWMKTIRQQPRGNKVPTPLTGSKLLTLIASQLSTQPFKTFPSQLQQTALGDIQLSFDSVPYKPFLIWVWTLNNDFAIALKQLSIERTKTRGLVKLMVIIAVR